MASAPRLVVLRIALTIVALAGLPGCVDPPLPPSISGLRPVSHQWVAEGGTGIGHAREVVLDGDLLIVADANGLPILRREASGALTLVHAVTRERPVHCSSIALHQASRSVLCAAGDGGAQMVIDIRDPAAPTMRPWQQPDATIPYYSVPDIAVVGDDAWLAANEQGLVHALVGPDGMPGAFERVAGVGEVTQVALIGDRIAYLDRVEGLVVLDAATREPLGSAPLAGPTIDLEATGDRLLVSMGSEGVQVFALDAAGQPRPLTSVQPRCVATGADLEGDALAVVCLSGVTLYDIGGETPRVTGFVPARFGMLDVAFAPYGLVVVDWYLLDVFSTHLDGQPTVPDAPRGMRLVPGADARIPLRNPGELALDVSWGLSDHGRKPRRMGALTLGPGEETELRVPYAALAASGSTRNAADIVFSSPSRDIETRTRVWHRAPDEEPARGMVAIGDAFPVLRRTSPGNGPDTLLVSGEPTLVMFLTVDCYLQWPQLEDMAWAQRHDTGQLPPTILFLTSVNLDPFDPSGYMSHFDAGNLFVVEWADYVGSVPGAEVEPVPLFAFERTYLMRLPGADYPHDYAVDASGTVTATSRCFRGRWPLGE